MRRNVNVPLKLADTVFRGVFLLACTYGLEVIDSGRFGLVATLVAFTAFLMGYESFNDLQRRAAGYPSNVIRRCLNNKLLFHGFHNAWLIPVLFVAFSAGSIGTPMAIVLIIVIAVAEMIGSQSYYAVLLDPRNYGLLLLSNIKNLVQALVVLVAPHERGEPLTFEQVLWLWGLISMAYVPLAALVWALTPRLAQASTIDPERDPQYPVCQSVRLHYRASYLHFLAGLVAIAALQADRFVVGVILGPHELGIYFRNITLAGVALQVFSIISFNRVSPRIYSLSRDKHFEKSKSLALQEYLWFFKLGAMVFAVAWLGNYLLHDPASKYGVDSTLLGVLVIGVMLRAGADYVAVLLLSVRLDREVLRNQFLSVVTGVAVLAFLAVQYGLAGAIWGTLLTPLVSLLLNRQLMTRLA